jgi:response regulator of citrate/malate metabolism
VISVLVVDDDFMVAKVHRGFVDRVPGFRTVGVAHRGTDALDLAERLRPDLVLLDIYLPDISGLEVLRRLRARPGGPDVLAVTAARDVDTVREALQSGVVHYLVKPFALAALQERLERFAEARRRLLRASAAEQHDIDGVIDLLRGTVGSRLPKGLAESSCRLVATVLARADGDLSAVEVAAGCGMSRVAVRRYLDYLVGAGRAEMRPRYGGTGRPEHRYRWTAGPATPPQGGERL